MEVGEGKLRPALPEDNIGELREVIDLICMTWDGDDSVRPTFANITSTLRMIDPKQNQREPVCNFVVCQILDLNTARLILVLLFY